ncbi:hypothetical protein CI109_101328 [Kwoniella shandongensis]|uniref:Uncharacterized protein n=1 Tax=Kwoniella shandongensis TaxID=1734106 RepID=A0A5M6BU04_9TREE|nr:uncharacterized protein CI109_005292 [Kwoniella shandongensis]KAA5526336.1 hypothetical protein CI109_005292 [Kwoniella shandongensis]
MGYKLDQFKHAFTSKEAFVKYIEAPPPIGEEQVSSDDRRHRWTNLDLAPSPPQDRKWTRWTFLAFWGAHAANASNWTAGSSIISLGLYPLDTWLSLAFAHLFITILIVANGRGPARYHIGFPVFARSVYGMWGSYMAVAMRAIVCIIWNGVNSYYGGRLVTVAITAIWPRYKLLPNALPASAGITSVNLASFFIFMFFFMAISFVHSRDLKWFYYIKSVFVIGAMHGVLAWWMIKSGGVSFTTLAASKPLTKNAHIWLVLRAFNAGLGTASSLTVNQGDMARYADKPNSQLWTTLIGYPIASAIPCLYGILVASAAKKMTGKAYWNLWDTLDYMLDQYPHNSGARFGIFLAAVAMALAYLAVNLATNSLPFGSDVSALFPRWMTIRRGQVICTALGIVIVPWKLLVSATAFITFLSGYGYWLAPIAACMFTDYYVVKKGNLIIPDLYIGDSSSRYWYNRGWNPRACTITILALVPCLPSFAASISPSLPIAQGGKNMFYISFVMTYFLAMTMYVLSYNIWPEKKVRVPEKTLRFERYADENDEEEKRVMGIVTAEEGSEVEEIDSKPVEGESKSYVVPTQ